MACTISISDSHEDVWMVNNSLFSSFAKIVVERHANEQDIVSQVQLAESMNGVSLDILYDNQPQLAVRLREVFLTVANEIALGNYPLPKSTIETKSNSQMECRELFSDLVYLLDKCDFSKTQ